LKQLLGLSLAALDIAGTEEDGEAGIFWEARIRAGEFAEKKDGAAIRLDMAGVKARSAEARCGWLRLNRRT
jgi:hypothetical protein